MWGVEDPINRPIRPDSSKDLVVMKTDFRIKSRYFEPGLSVERDVKIIVGGDGVEQVRDVINFMVDTVEVTKRLVTKLNLMCLGFCRVLC